MPFQDSSDRRIPAWAVDPFKDHLSHLKATGKLLELSTMGISSIRAMPDMARAIIFADGDESDDAKEKIERAKEYAKFAQEEVDAGFPQLYADATIGLWTSLESTIREFFRRWVANRESARNLKCIASIRVTIGEWESLSLDERPAFIIDHLERATAANLKQGIGRFECILTEFGLGGAVDDDNRRELFELQKVRNVLVHNRGIADRQLIESCPWMDLSIGKNVRVKPCCYSRYAVAVNDYCANIIHRLLKLYDAERLKTEVGSDEEPGAMLTPDRG